ncbi:MAG: CpsD/CapB family tyrosine-protein kinase [Candidatus Omnitrophica bacterium]|nr:CpsD/CapB family tyrosine-protein kinase [Candidatus Omnitrophota bacterium]
MSKITKALERSAVERASRKTGDPVVPKERTGEVDIAQQSQELDKTKEERKVIISRIDPHVVSYYQPRSPISEQYRILRTNIQSISPKAPPRTILFTSSTQREGKTMTAVNLAVSMSHNPAKRILLVDADLRRGSVARYIGVQIKSGLSQYLSNGTGLEEIVLKTEIENLDVIPAGRTPRNPSELLDSEKCRELMRTLKSRYDYVIVDSPPAMPLADAAVLSSQVDGVVLVIQSGRTQRNVVRETQALLSQIQARILGFVLTHAEYYIPRYGYYKY